MLWGIPGCSWPVWISAGRGEALNTHIVNVCRTALLVGVCKTFWSNWGVQKVANIVHVKIKSKTPWQQMKIIYGYLVNIARQYYPCVLVSGLSIYKLFCLQFAPSTTPLILSSLLQFTTIFGESEICLLWNFCVFLVPFCYCWQVNRLEQLCSNLCAEAMQHYYDSHILLLLTA